MLYIYIYIIYIIHHIFLINKLIIQLILLLYLQLIIYFNKAFILALGVNTGTFKIGYSYDVTVSTLNNGISGGSHEVSLGYNVNCKKRGPTWRTISCPSF